MYKCRKNQFFKKQFFNNFNIMYGRGDIHTHTDGVLF